VLYDKAPVVSYDEVEKLFKEEFGKKPEEIFATFEKDAIASASIAQVHRATLHDGTRVAVKVCCGLLNYFEIAF
jgi:aarF domain-containing kinase